MTKAIEELKIIQEALATATDHTLLIIDILIQKEKEKRTKQFLFDSLKLVGEDK